MAKEQQNHSSSINKLDLHFEYAIIVFIDKSNQNSLFYAFFQSIYISITYPLKSKRLLDSTKLDTVRHRGE